LKKNRAENIGFRALHYVAEKKSGYGHLAIILMKSKGVVENEGDE
jgi:hypothetical protein